jgi:excisionase family DNA binding protein
LTGQDGMVCGWAVQITLKETPREKSRRACYSAKEVADKLGVDIKSVYQGIKTGQIPSIKLGRRELIPAAPFDRMLGEKAENP